MFILFVHLVKRGKGIAHFTTLDKRGNILRVVSPFSVAIWLYYVFGLTIKWFGRRGKNMNIANHTLSISSLYLKGENGINGAEK